MIEIITSLSAEKRLEHLTRRLTASENPVLIVPEQFLFETERTMYRLLGARKIADTQITGFSKLAADIAKRYGTPKLYADDIVKAVTMVKTLSRLKRTAGYDAARDMLAVVADLKAAAVTPDILRRKSKGGSDGGSGFESDIDAALSRKLADIGEVYSTYCETLKADFADRLDDNRIAADLIYRTDCFAGKDVFLYEFDSFSASQIGLIKALADTSGGESNIEILFRADVRADIADIKGKERDWSVRRVKRQLAAADCAYTVTDLGGLSYSPHAELLTADHVSDECGFVAAEIRRLITKEGYSCNEIAVLVCGELNSGAVSRLKEAMSEYGIQSYADLPEPIISKPMTRFIISALEAAVSLDTPELLTYIRSGFVRVSAETEKFDRPPKLTAGKPSEHMRDKRYAFAKGGSRLTKKLSKRSMDLLERAAYRYALTKREWVKEFPEQNRDLREAEPLRREIVQPLTHLAESCRNADGDKITEKLCAFLLETMQFQRTVAGLCRNVELSGISGFLESKKLTEEFRQLWDLIIEVFESLHAALAKFPIGLAEYTELLRGVFSSVNIAKPPAVLDAVVIGDPRRSRLNKVRAVFITGANAELFPKSAVYKNPAFSGRDIEVLSESGLDIHPNLEERYYYERFIVDKALSLPSEKLYISAPLSDAAWEELQPSPVIKELADERGLTVKKTSDLPLSFRASAIKAARRIYAEEKENAFVLREFAADRHTDNQKNIGAGIERVHILTPQTADRLFAADYFSPTKIETMMGCRFRFFCEYGLRLDIPSPENAEEPLARQRGSIIHYCLDSAIRRMGEGEIGDSDLDGFVETCIREYRERKLPWSYARSNRQSYMLMSLKAGIVRMVRHIRAEFGQSGWRPLGFEHKVDYPFGDIRLRGIIDRIDVREDGSSDTKSVRVIDYKAGGKEMDFPTVFYGLNMQMLLYLFAVSGENGGGADFGAVKPAAALYLPSNGASVKGAVLPDASAEVIERNWLSVHKPSGIMIEESPPPKSFNNLKKLSFPAYGKLKDYCGKLIDAQAGRVKRGNIQAVPILLPTETDGGICKHCAFSAACGKTKVKTVNKKCMERVIDN